jgi:hypothetical protein
VCVCVCVFTLEGQFWEAVLAWDIEEELSRKQRRRGCACITRTP